MVPGRPFYSEVGWAYDLLVADAAELAARGHEVVLLEPVPELLDQARSRCPGARAFAADLGLAPPVEVDAVTRRGVLNDVLGDADRSAAVATLAAILRPGGVVVLAVATLTP